MSNLGGQNVVVVVVLEINYVILGGQNEFERDQVMKN